MEMKLVPSLSLSVNFVRQACITQRLVNQQFQLVFPVRLERILPILEHYLTVHVNSVTKASFQQR